MADVKWIKITTDIFDDEKILLIESLPEGDSIIVIWFKLLCLAGKINNSGVFVMGNIPYTDKMLSTIFRRKESTVKLALDTFEKFGMVEIINDVITIPNWGKHQSLDQLENKKEYQRNYMREYRAKQKEITCNTNSKTNCKTNGKANVSSLDIDKDIEIDKEREINNSGEKRTVFRPPTLDEVQAYCQERNNTVDADRFLDYYTSNGWFVGKHKMKDWKAAVRTWERNGFSNTATSKQSKQNKAVDDYNAKMERLAAWASGNTNESEVQNGG